jgi:vacuolar-type H+-ATPase subunit I/STV1
MKTLLKLFVFSFLLFSISCQSDASKRAKFDSIVVQNAEKLKDSEPSHFVVDSNDLVNFQYIQEVQQGVADTSHTSVGAAILTAAEIGNKLDELSYKASIRGVELNQKIKTVDNKTAELDQNIKDLNKLNKMYSDLIEQRKYQLAKIKKQQDESRYFANLE